MNYRSSSDYEQHGQHSSWVKENPFTKNPVSPRSKMISNPSNSSELHSIPTALIVSPSGERITCAIDSLEDTSNPFLNSTAHDENCPPKLPLKHDLIRLQSRRKAQNRNRKHVNKIILTQKGVTARRQPKCAAVQTDASLSLISFPEHIGDGRRLSQSFMDLTTSTNTMEAIGSVNVTNKQYLSENQRKFLSFLLMIILIFWLTSIILDVEIPAELCRIAHNYISSRISIIFFQEKQLTFIEKCWKYIQNVLE